MEDEKKVILYIDDDEDEYVIVKFYFSKFREKYKLVWYDKFSDGLEQIKDDKYDLCLLDYRLGSDSGIDIIKKARNSGSRIPILFLSGQGDNEVDHEALQAGATGCLDKGDLNPEVLESAIRDCLIKGSRIS